MKPITGIFSVLLVLTLLSACGHKKKPVLPPAPVNNAPSANAGSDQSVDEETTVTLTGSGTDTDGSIVSYSWTQLSGSMVTIQDAGMATATFLSPTLITTTTLSFELTVTDDKGATASDTVDVVVNPVNSPPVANAGGDQAVDEQTTVTLTGSGTDVDGTIDSYSWLQIAGADVVLSDAAIVTPSFTAPQTSSTITLSFELTVTDNEGATATDQVDITVNPVTVPPTVDAGADFSRLEKTTVFLNATAQDTDGTIAQYLWQQTSGITVTLMDATTASSSFIAPEITSPDLSVTETLAFDITVTDDQGATATDNVVIVIKNAQPPIVASGILNDTGQVFCRDSIVSDGDIPHADINLNCNDLVDADGDLIPEGQDGDYGRDLSDNDDSDGHAGFSFTKLDQDGNPLPLDATSWSCVRDNVTGFVWEVKTTDGGLQHNQNVYSWYSSDTVSNGGNAGTQNGGVCSGSDCDTESYVTAINQMGLCGAADWHLPTIQQLFSILDFQLNISLDTNFFPNVAINNTVWTSSTSAKSTDKAWVMSSSSIIQSSFSKSGNSTVRLVRGEN